MNDANTRLQELMRVCRDRGLPITIQRRVVLEVLAERTDHPSADQIFEAVRAAIPNVSRTTIYRVLETLIELGLVTRINQPGTAERFEARLDRHHHVVCRRCTKIEDVEDSRLNRLALPKVAGFKVSDYSVYFSGLCKACERKH